MPIGTAILQDLQRTESAQAMADLPVEENSNGSIDIEIMPAETSVANDASTVSSAVSAEVDRPNDVSTNGPTLASLQRSMGVRGVSPLVADALQTAESDLAVEPNLPNSSVEAIAVSNPRSDFPHVTKLARNNARNSDAA